MGPYRIVKKRTRKKKVPAELAERAVFLPAPPFKLWRKEHRIKVRARAGNNYLRRKLGR